MTGNPRLRALLAEARSEQMPKENIERAIKKATDKTLGDFKEIVYEGYGPHGIAYLVEAATDNNTRTVANVRSYFNKCGGSLGTSGSVAFMFDRKCTFRIKEKEGIDLEELELELIDYGVEELFEQVEVDKDDNETKVIVMIGSADKSGTMHDPFTTGLRVQMLTAMFPRLTRMGKVIIVPLKEGRTPTMPIDIRKHFQ